MEILKYFVKVASNGKKRGYYEVKCPLCGNIFELRTDSYKRTKSCGCLKKEQDKKNLSKYHKHKTSGTKVYRTFQRMKRRCYNPKDKRYINYGGRGITICDEWLKDYAKFLEWSLKNGYEDKKTLSIDRIDNSKGYSPENCRWADVKTQCRNRRSNVVFLYEGKERCVKEISEMCGVNYGVLMSRIKSGISLEEATKVDYVRKNNKAEKCWNCKLTQNDMEDIITKISLGSTIKNLSMEYGIEKSTIYSRLKRMSIPR